MSCSNPFRIVPKYRYLRHEAVEVPCSWCMSCRIDRRNMWQDRVEIEGRNYAGFSFVTFTYDDYFLRWSKNGSHATLSKMDCSNFIKRVRRVLDRYGAPPLSHRNFKYICVGEYGSENQVLPRPHYHFIFNGLDFASCNELFRSCWQYGLIDSLPVLHGGIRYVLKYCDKMQHGVQAEIEYDDKGIERPFFHASNGIASQWFWQHKDEICDKGYYLWKNKERPLPSYFKNLFMLPNSLTKVNMVNSLRQYASAMQISDVFTARNYRAYAKEKAAISMARSQGTPVYSVYEQDRVLPPKTYSGNEYLDLCMSRF